MTLLRAIGRLISALLTFVNVLIVLGICIGAFAAGGPLIGFGVTIVVLLFVIATKQ
jgi:hypothetical protein